MRQLGEHVSGWRRTAACPIYSAFRAKRFCTDHNMRFGAPLFFTLWGASVCARSLSIKLSDATYTGYHNATSGLDVWLGIRYAAPPLGDLRWKTAQAVGAGKDVVNATTMPLQCVQSVVSLVVQLVAGVEPNIRG